VNYELDSYRLVNGGICVSYPRDSAFDYLVQTDRPTSSSSVLRDRDLSDSDCRVGTASDACAESRGVAEWFDSADRRVHGL
jgi:hypothetical protein